MIQNQNEINCLGCGALVPNTTGDVHAYIMASPGCWQLYCDLQDWRNSLSDVQDVTAVQDLVDAYAAQHATNPDRRNRQSVAVHLLSLCASLEFSIPGTQRRRMIGSWTHRDYPMFEPLPERYSVTVRNVADATIEQREVVVAEMARSTWSAWSRHHEEIRSLLTNDFE